MIESSCHCGLVKLEIDSDLPENLLSCNCSVCRRNGSLMSYFPKDRVRVLAENDNLLKYVWGDKKIAFVHCKGCGNYSHWEGLEPEVEKTGVNSRLFTSHDISKLPIRRFDGAETWKFLD